MKIIALHSNSDKSSRAKYLITIFSASTVAPNVAVRSRIRLSVVKCSHQWFKANTRGNAMLTRRAKCGISMRPHEAVHMKLLAHLLQRDQAEVRFDHDFAVAHDCESLAL